MPTDDPCLTSYRDLIAGLPAAPSEARTYLDIQQRRLTDFIAETADQAKVTVACWAVTKLVDAAIAKRLIGQ